MAYDSRVYRILIASPSDVSEERDAAVRVMYEWNDLHSHNRHVTILPLRWETHTAPEYNVRPQEAINRRIVDDCDLLVGIFWTRLRTPTGEADSGTLEEIERVAKAGKPVMLYFSHAPTDPSRVDTAQLELLKAFKERISANALIETYKSSLDFRDKFNSQLEIKIRDLQAADDRGQPPPLDLQFLSWETKQFAGSPISATVDILEIPGPSNVSKSTAVSGSHIPSGFRLKRCSKSRSPQSACVCRSRELASGMIVWLYGWASAEP
jgi:nucleoside 2-deoxyribosyltransferase